eukprot:GEMP01012198.1.p1 GENE.GEMP01012198.1~~GEMP01012198.1.p1  ORF type:complete len:560 (+),score=122.77 GEMP01012198.1:28-1707(+)
MEIGHSLPMIKFHSEPCLLRPKNVSKSVAEMNWSGHRAMQRLTNSSTAAASGAHQIVEVPLQDMPTEQSIAETVDTSLKSIASIHRSVLEFDPSLARRKLRGSVIVSHSKNQAAKRDDDDFANFECAMKARFATYKFHRSLPQPLPPLTKNSLMHERKKTTSPYLRWPIEDRRRAPMKQYWSEKFRRDYANGEEVRERARNMMRHKYQSYSLSLLPRNVRRELEEGSTGEDDEERKSQWTELVVVANFITQISELHQKIKADPASFVSATLDAEPAAVEPEAEKEEEKIPGIVGDNIAVGDLSKSFCMLFLRWRIFLRRKRARVVLSAISSWETFGTFLLAAKKYQRKVRMLQIFWRVSSKRIEACVTQIATKWIKIEKKLLKIEFDTADRERGLLGEDELSRLPMEERIALAIIIPTRRSSFIKHEMTLRRYNMLNDIDDWKERMEAYEAQVLTWKADREAQAIFDTSVATSTACPMMPPCPVQFPSLDVIRDWVKRAKNDIRERTPFKARTNYREKAAVQEPVPDAFAFMDQGPAISASREDLEQQRLSIKLPETQI